MTSETIEPPNSSIRIAAVQNILTRMNKKNSEDGPSSGEDSFDLPLGFEARKQKAIQNQQIKIIKCASTLPLFYK